ncbi:MAG: hypothetical protein JSV79_04540, partial [Armatimonadota bacterium]
ASPDEQNVTLSIQTDCEKIAVLAEALEGKEIDAYLEIAQGSDGVILSAARGKLLGCCAACAVPVGIFKALQVAARVALPKGLSITLATD